MIRDKDEFLSVHTFEGLQFGKLSPMDIDGFLDFAGKFFVFLEGKKTGNKLFGGQRLGYTNLSKSLSKPNIVIHYQHKQPAEGEDIVVADQLVKEIYCRGYWTTYENPTWTVKQVINEYMNQYL